MNEPIKSALGEIAAATNPFEGREVFRYHPIDEGGLPKPKEVSFYMPRRREWAELSTDLLVICALKRSDLDDISKDISQRVNLVKMGYALLDHFVIPKDRDHIDDLSSEDVWAIKDAIQPTQAALTEEQEKNSPSHSELENEALNANNATKSLKPSEVALDPVSNPGE